MRIFVLMLVLTASACAQNYYVSATTGSDSNPGTTTGAPWLHFPGMPGCTNNCASHVCAPGETWNFLTKYFLSGTWTIPSACNGSTGSPITMQANNNVSQTISGGIKLDGSLLTLYAGTVGQCPSPGDGTGACNLAYIDLPMTGAVNCPTSGCVPFDAVYTQTAPGQVLTRRQQSNVNGYNKCKTNDVDNPIIVTAANVAAADTLCGAPVWGLASGSGLWAAGQAVTKGSTYIWDSNGNLELASTSGTTGGSAPTWAVNVYQQTTDNDVVWVNEGIVAGPDANGRAIVAGQVKPAGAGEYQCFNQAIYNIAQLPVSTHALFDVEVLNHGSWSASKLRLSNLVAGAQSSVTATFTGPDVISGSPTALQFSGCVSQNWYIAYNVKEQLTAAPGLMFGQWYFDPCPTTDPCSVPENTGRLWLSYSQAENVTTETFWIPQLSPYSPQVLVFKDNHDWLIQDLQFNLDGYVLPPQGRGTVAGGTMTPPAIGIYGTSHHITIGTKTAGVQHPVLIEQTQGHGLSLYDTANNITASYDLFADIGGFAFRNGVPATDADTTVNVTHDNLFSQNIAVGVQQTDPSGEGGACYTGNGFNISVLHNTLNDWVSGMCLVGSGLNATAAGEYVMYGHHFNYNYGHGRTLQQTLVLALMNDYGALIHAATSWPITGCPLSPLHPPTGWPNPTDETQFCSEAVYNIVFNAASDYTAGFPGAKGCYLDQATSVFNCSHNIIGNISHQGTFVNNNATANLTSQVQYNLFKNNIFFGIGAVQYKTFGSGESLYSKGGLSNSSFAFINNIAILNYANGEKIMPNPSTRFGCYDFSQNPPTPWACTNNWFVDKGSYFYTDNGNFTYTICATSACDSHLTTQQLPPFNWPSPNGGEDANSQIGDPGIIKIDGNSLINGTANFLLTNLSLLRSLNFVQWDTSQIGAYDNTVTVPNVALSVEYFNSVYSDTNTDFLGNYAGHPMQQFFGGSLTGGTLK